MDRDYVANMNINDLILDAYTAYLEGFNFYSDVTFFKELEKNGMPENILDNFNVQYDNDGQIYITFK